MVKPLRIGVTGTHSTGKSIFCDSVKRACETEGLRLKVIGSPGQSARDIGFQILRDHTFESTMWIVARTIQSELEEGLRADVVISDRAVIDAIGYWSAALKFRGECANPLHWKIVMDLVSEYSKSYDLLFATKLDASLPMGSLRERDKDQKFRASAADEISASLRAARLYSIELIPGNIDKCIERCLLAARERIAGNP